MRKITLKAALIGMCLTSSVYAQNSNRYNQKLAITNANADVKQLYASEKAINSSNRNGIGNSILAPFYTEDFSSGSLGNLPTGWTQIDNAGNAEIWTWSDSLTQVIYNNGVDSFPSATAANGYMIFDSDGYGDNMLPEDASITSPAINCIGHANVKLQFTHYYRILASTAIVAVSNDGITFTDVATYAATTLNPEFADIDISAIAGNQAAVYIRFSYTGDWSWYWSIDDITLAEPAAVDGGVTSINGLVSGCGLSATTAIEISIINNGASAISGFPVSYTINGGIPVVEIHTASIAAGATANYTFTATADFSVPNTYNIVAATAIPLDGNAANDASNISVTNVAANNLSTPLTMGFEPGESLADWSIEDVNADGVSWEILAPVNTYPHNGTQCMRKRGSGLGAIPEDNDWLFVPCLDLTAGTTYSLDCWYKNFELVNPCYFEVYVGNANNGAAMTQMIIQPAVPVDTAYQQGTGTFTVPTSGTYYVGFHAYVPTGLGGSSSLRIDDVNISISTGVNNIAKELGVSVSPNPSNGVIQIRNFSNEKDFSLEIYNSVGQIVLQQNLNNLTSKTLDLSSLAKGVYSVKMKGAKGEVAQKLILN